MQGQRQSAKSSGPAELLLQVRHVLVALCIVDCLRLNELIQTVQVMSLQPKHIHRLYTTAILATMLMVSHNQPNNQLGLKVCGTGTVQCSIYRPYTEKQQSTFKLKFSFARLQ